MVAPTDIRCDLKNSTFNLINAAKKSDDKKVIFENRCFFIEKSDFLLFFIKPPKCFVQTAIKNFFFFYASIEKIDLQFILQGAIIRNRYKA